jgi:hypothetical protein
VDRDVRKILRDLPYMLPETGISASIFAPFRDAIVGRAEDGDEAVLQLDRIAELLSHFIQPNLGYVGPDAQDVGHVRDLQTHSNTM